MPKYTILVRCREPNDHNARVPRTNWRTSCTQGSREAALALAEKICRERYERYPARFHQPAVELVSEGLASPSAHVDTYTLNLPPIRHSMGGRRCNKCGCVDEDSCIGPKGELCHWVNRHLCSGCA